ncbi:UDP-N-acetylmuramate--L-alanine ligase [Pricia antarctica]|uniref:UDP-N-acetylmuramate--L-alanine ligase n=1 Tax=Pricia antarctica TaxID=641691 RepID=A0A1G7GLM1_9FLAO|nr:UDP-N-acetylmuramate--L-alanine ligase [Pricia antarctica]SDE89035.1 UDP-N-acetylmuramate--L-alanine ligase [Pricia antarctica]
MNLKTLNNVYFIGIGGIGMSALARYFRFIGKNVAGYDKTETPLTLELSSLGIDVHFEDDIHSVPEKFYDTTNTLVIYTPAVPVDHSEYLYFLNRDFELKKRSEVLGLITKDSFCFAVAGTHGKTTTSCILAHLLKETNTSFTAFLGGISEDFNSNFVFEGTDYSVVEADEFDRSFLRLFPDVACVTSMDADHLDIYGDENELKKSFKEFTERIQPGGKLFVRKGLPLDGITYGIEDGSDFCIQNIRIEKGTYIFDIITTETILTEVKFNKPGRHNLLNGLVAFAMATQTGIAPSDLAKALETFKGVQRRFSYKIKRKDFIFIDDYAHHPTEIDAVYQAISEMHPGKKILAVFQPHLFSRTRDFADDFAKSLSQFDSILMLDIYPAREKPMAGITSEWLLEKIDHSKKKVLQKTNLIKEIKKQNPEILVTMGAGDIGLEITKLKTALENAD